MNKLTTIFLVLLLSGLVALPVSAEEAPPEDQIDAEAVWQNIGNLQNDVSALGDEVDGLRVSDEGLQSQLDGIQAENETLSGKVDIILQYLDEMKLERETAKTEDAEKEAAYKQFLTDLQAGSDAKLLEAAEAEAGQLQLLNEQLKQGFSDVSGNSLEVAASTDDGNTLTICVAVIVSIGLGFLCGQQVLRRLR